MNTQPLLRRLRAPALALALAASAVSLVAQSGPLVKVVNGRLEYTKFPAHDGTPGGDELPDFSGVGYRNSEVNLPDLEGADYRSVPKITLTPNGKDRAADIRNAINSLHAQNKPVRGIYGIVEFAPGDYEVKSTVTITKTGIVLRGKSGQSKKPRIYFSDRGGSADEGNDCFVFSGPAPSVEGGSSRRVTGAYTPYGSKTLTLSSAAGLSEKDWVYLHFQYNQAWINMLNMDEGPKPWTTGATQYDAERQILKIDGNKITLDAPIMDPVDSRYCTVTVRRFTGDSRIQNCAVENLRIDSYYNGDSLQHGARAVAFAKGVKHSWVSGVDAFYFMQSCVSVQDPSVAFITVEDCRMSSFKGRYKTGTRYSFTNDGQRSLFENCRVDNGGNSKDGGRHDFVSGSWTPGPGVFVNCSTQGALSDSGPHHRWTTGHLYDNIKTDRDIRVRDRGQTSSGSMHGWVGGQVALWNCTTDSFTVQDVPGPFTNFAIGCTGTQNNGGRPAGYIHAPRQTGALQSLFHAQLKARLGLPL